MCLAQRDRARPQDAGRPHARTLPRSQSNALMPGRNAGVAASHFPRIQRTASGNPHFVVKFQKTNS